MNGIEIIEKIKINPKILSIKLDNFIKKYLNELNRDKIFIGVSGGLDSAVVLKLCVDAVGANKVTAVMLPEKDSEKKHILDAENLIKLYKVQKQLVKIDPYLKIACAKFPISVPKPIKGWAIRRLYSLYSKSTGKNPFFEGIKGLKNTTPFSSYLRKTNSHYRLKHRVRMAIIYCMAERDNGLVVGAANKTEMEIGFFVKYGIDHSTDIMPLSNLYKTQVIQLAKYLKLPKNIIEKQPSPDIIPGLIDENTISISYKKLDLILYGLENKVKTKDIGKVAKIDEEIIDYVKNLKKESAHMRQIYVPEN